MARRGLGRTLSDASRNPNPYTPTCAIDVAHAECRANQVIAEAEELESSVLGQAEWWHVWLGIAGAGVVGVAVGLVVGFVWAR